jgi:hypothetical protein
LLSVLSAQFVLRILSIKVLRTGLSRRIMSEGLKMLGITFAEKCPKHMMFLNLLHAAHVTIQV